jgi:hypothetical protein
MGEETSLKSPITLQCLDFDSFQSYDIGYQAGAKVLYKNSPILTFEHPKLVSETKSFPCPICHKELKIKIDSISDIKSKGLKLALYTFIVFAIMSSLLLILFPGIEWSILEKIIFPFLSAAIFFICLFPGLVTVPKTVKIINDDMIEVEQFCFSTHQIERRPTLSNNLLTLWKKKLLFHYQK